MLPSCLREECRVHGKCLLMIPSTSQRCVPSRFRGDADVIWQFVLHWPAISVMLPSRLLEECRVRSNCLLMIPSTSQRCVFSAFLAPVQRLLSAFHEECVAGMPLPFGHLLLLNADHVSRL